MAATAPKLRRGENEINHAAEKHFDIGGNYRCVDSTVNREVYTIWVYEKGEDCEPLLILKDAQDFMGVDGWLVGNIYSTLQHGLLLQHEELENDDPKRRD